MSNSYSRLISLVALASLASTTLASPALKGSQLDHYDGRILPRAVTTCATTTVSKCIKTVTDTLSRATTTITKTKTATLKPSAATTITSTKTKTVTHTISASAVTTTATATVTQSAICSACQLLANPGFEETFPLVYDGTSYNLPGQATDWLLTQAPGVNFTVAPSGAIPGGSHSGASSGVWEVVDASAFQQGTPTDAYQPIQIDGLACTSSTQTYSFNGWVKVQNNYCYFNVYDYDSGAQIYNGFFNDDGLGTPVWQAVTGTATLAAKQAVIILAMSCSEPRNVWIDDVSLIPLSPL